MLWPSSRCDGIVPGAANDIAEAVRQTADFVEDHLIPGIAEVQIDDAGIAREDDISAIGKVDLPQVDPFKGGQLGGRQHRADRGGPYEPLDIFQFSARQILDEGLVGADGACKVKRVQSVAAAEMVPGIDRLGFRQRDQVVAVPAIEPVDSGAPVQLVLSDAAAQRVVAADAAQGVVTAGAVQYVVAGAAPEVVATVTSHNCIGRGAARHAIGFPLPGCKIDQSGIIAEGDFRNIEGRGYYQRAARGDPDQSRLDRLKLAEGGDAAGQLTDRRLDLLYAAKIVKVYDDGLGRRPGYPDPVKPRSTDEAVAGGNRSGQIDMEVIVAFAAFVSVVAQIIPDIVVAVSADDDVITRTAREKVVTTSAFDAVISLFAVQGVGDAAPDQRVISAAAVQICPLTRRASPPGNVIVAVVEPDPTTRETTVGEIERSATADVEIALDQFELQQLQAGQRGASNGSGTDSLEIRQIRSGKIDVHDYQRVGPSTADKLVPRRKVRLQNLNAVVTVAAIDLVDTRTSLKKVVAGAAIQDVVAEPAFELVVPAQAIGRIGTIGAVEIVGADPAREHCHDATPGNSHYPIMEIIAKSRLNV